MLANYLAQTRGLLQNPSAPTALYNDADLTRWINIARGQMAGETECIRAIGTVSTVVSQQPYNFASVNTGVSGTTGIQGVISVSRVNYSVASGARWVTPRPWPWFDLYVLNNPPPLPSGLKLF